MPGAHVSRVPNSGRLGRFAVALVSAVGEQPAAAQKGTRSGEGPCSDPVSGCCVPTDQHLPPEFLVQPGLPRFSGRTGLLQSLRQLPPAHQNHQGGLPGRPRQLRLHLENHPEVTSEPRPRLLLPQPLLRRLQRV